MTSSLNEKFMLEMFHKATGLADEQIDLLALNAFCSLIREDPGLIIKATELMLQSIKSENPACSLKSLEVLGECMSKCGEEFRQKVSKFHFLNRLIELVSKKYYAEKTPPDIRNKIMDYLLLWSAEYPDKLKIKEAYDMLCKEGVDHKFLQNTFNSVPRKCDFLDTKTDEKLKKLLKSGNRDDLKLANLLIQHHVNQDAKATELLVRQKLELDEARNTVNLFNQMIDLYLDNNQPKDVEESLEELYNRCVKFCPLIQRMPEITDFKDEQIVAEALAINDELTGTIERYKKLSLPNPILEFETSEKENHHNSSNNVENEVVTVDTEKMVNEVDCTEDILFDSPAFSTDFITLTPLKPTPLQREFKKTNSGESEDLSKKLIESETGLSYFDKISDELFKENLKNIVRVGKFGQKSKKVTLNEIKGEMANDKTENYELHNSKGFNNCNNSNNLALPIGAKKKSNIEHLEYSTEERPKESTIECTAVSEDEEIISSEISNYNFCVSNKQNTEKHSKRLLRNLVDISLEEENFINGCQPELQQIKIFDDIQDLNITFSFTDEHPDIDVFVIVISVTNQGLTPIKNFHLDAGVKKPCKLRLLSPNITYLPVSKSVQPSSENIKQVLILYNPTGKSIDVTCIVSYNSTDDPDPFKDPIVVKIPYFN